MRAVKPAWPRCRALSGASSSWRALLGSSAPPAPRRSPWDRRRCTRRRTCRLPWPLAAVWHWAHLRGRNRDGCPTGVSRAQGRDVGLQASWPLAPNSRSLGLRVPSGGGAGRGVRRAGGGQRGGIEGVSVSESVAPHGRAQAAAGPSHATRPPTPRRRARRCSRHLGAKARTLKTARGAGGHAGLSRGRAAAAPQGSQLHKRARELTGPPQDLLFSPTATSPAGASAKEDMAAGRCVVCCGRTWSASRARWGTVRRKEVRKRLWTY